MGNTVRLHRVLTAPPERIYRAFTDPEAFAKWLPPHGFTAKVHELDAREGGKWRMHFTNLTTGGRHSFGGTYLELVPGRKVRYNARFDDPNLPGEMTTTVTLEATPFGTEMHVVQDGIPDMIPATQCYLGWQESLLLLKQLVEPEIREG